MYPPVSIIFPDLTSIHNCSPISAGFRNLDFILPIGWLTFKFNPATTAVDSNLFHAVLIFVWSFSFYLIKFFCPITFIPFYQAPEPVSLINPYYQISLAVFCLTLGLLFLFRRSRAVMLGFWFYFLSLFFMFRLGKLEYLNIVADRFIYLPSLGLCLCVGLGIERMRALASNNIYLKIFLQLALTIIFVGLAVKTWHQTSIWKNNLSLWDYQIKNGMPNAMIYNNRGFVYVEKGRYDLAIEDYTQAMTIDPAYVDSYSNRGFLYAQMGNDDLAFQDLNKAIALDPLSQNAHYRLGKILMNQNHIDQALEHFLSVIKIDPRFEDAFYNAGVLYFNKNDYEKALDYFERGLRINPQNSSIINNIGVIYLHGEKLNQALEKFNQAIQMNPTYSDSFNNRGIVYLKLGKWALALKDFDKVLSLNPNDPYAQYNRRVILNSIKALK